MELGYASWLDNLCGSSIGSRRPLADALNYPEPILRSLTTGPLTTALLADHVSASSSSFTDGRLPMESWLHQTSEAELLAWAIYDATQPRRLACLALQRIGQHMHNSSTMLQTARTTPVVHRERARGRIPAGRQESRSPACCRPREAARSHRRHA